jgi:hypothetical protein
MALCEVVSRYAVGPVEHGASRPASETCPLCHQSGPCTDSYIMMQTTTRFDPMHPSISATDRARNLAHRARDPDSTYAIVSLTYEYDAV